MIVRGGENMSPGEIEDVLLEHGAVEDAAVVGVPSIEWGEAVVGCGGAEVRRYASGTARLGQAAPALLPSARTHRVLAGTPPTNETGKLLRRVVKARLDGD